MGNETIFSSEYTSRTSQLFEEIKSKEFLFKIWLIKKIELKKESIKVSQLFKISKTKKYLWFE